MRRMAISPKDWESESGRERLRGWLQGLYDISLGDKQYASHTSGVNQIGLTLYMPTNNPHVEPLTYSSVASAPGARELCYAARCSPAACATFLLVGLSVGPSFWRDISPRLLDSSHEHAVSLLRYFGGLAFFSFSQAFLE